jgi:hypothetical protein
MENKKYEQLIDLIINEQEDKARELFHEIVVEKSREIYESIMDEEVMAEAHGEEDMDEGMHGQVGDLLDEINVEETGMTEEESDDIQFDDEAEEAGDELTHDAEEMHDEEGSVDKAELGDIKDKLDDLMAEFEALMSGGEGSEEEEVVGDEEEVVAEAVNLKQVGGKTYNTFGKMGDDGADKKSPVPANSGAKGMDSKPVKFSGDHEAVPTGPKGPSNAYAKGEKDLPGAGNFKNVPGKDNFKEKGESAPKAVTSQASGVNNKSPVAKG